jgi:D-arabinose 5-phosphate isomerase GutQ
MRLFSKILAPTTIGALAYSKHDESQRKVQCSGWFASLGSLPSPKETIKTNLEAISQKGYTSISLMQYQKKEIKNSAFSNLKMEMTIEEDPNKPKFQDKFSFMKFRNRKENEFDSLPESLEYVSKIKNLDDYLFSLGLASWKPNQGDKNYQLKFNKDEEIIMTFEGDILNRQSLHEFILLKKGKVKKVLEAKNSSQVQLDSSIEEETSDEELLLTLYKYFLNDCHNDQKALQQLVGLVNGPMAISIINKKSPERLLCFWRDVRIYLYGEALHDYNVVKTNENKSFLYKKIFSAISLSTIKPEAWIETSNFPGNIIHLITLLPNKEIQIESGGDPINVDKLVRSLTKTPIINAPQISPKNKKSHLRSEIFEQPLAIRRLLKIDENFLEDLDTIKLDFLEGLEDYFSPDQRLVITGCGSSFFAGKAGARFLSQMRLFRDVKVVNSVEFDSYSFVPQGNAISNIFGESSINDKNSRILIPQKDNKSSESVSIPQKKQIPSNVCIAVSQSGESSDVLNFLKELKNQFPDCLVIALTNTPGSTLTTMANASFFVNSGKEHAVAATKSVTNTVVAFYMLGLWFHYLFKGPRASKSTNFKPIGNLYERVQSLPSKISSSSSLSKCI